MTATPRRKLIEVSLPLEAINAEASREKSIRHGHPSGLHQYWARRPLAAARAVLFAQLVDDPSSHPDEFPTTAAQDGERARLHALLEQLVLWQNSNNESLLRQARAEIRKSNDGKLPAILDPFAGGGAIPLEAQRLGLEAHASDLNPLAVLINKALIEIPPKFAGLSPVFPGAASTRNGWSRVDGFAEDVRRYGDWMLDRAEKQIGSQYPRAVAPDGTEHTVIAWLWARAINCPSPACGISTPLVKSWWLSKRKGQEAFLSPTVVDDESVPGGRRVAFSISYDMTAAPSAGDDGTVGRKGAKCVACETAIPLAHVRSEAQAGRMAAQLTTVVAEGERRRLYLEPTAEHLAAASVARPNNVPIGSLPPHSLSPNSNQTVRIYGFEEFVDLFTPRQLVALTTLSDLVTEVRAKILHDGLAIGLPRGGRLEGGGDGADAYADAVATILAFAIDKQADLGNALCRWEPNAQCPRQLFARQNIPMVWDYAESNPFSSSSGSFKVIISGIEKALRSPAFGASNVPAGPVVAADAAARDYDGVVVSTDPPYYDNIGYSDLSDFFYIWLRRSLESVYPSLFATMLVPKAEELVANPHRMGREADAFFIRGFNSVFQRIRAGYEGDDDRLLTVYYAYKQQESDAEGTTSSGWHTLLDGLVNAGWIITATWPMRTETSSRLIASGANALASSIVLACRPRGADAPTATRRSFVAELKSELPEALRTLIQGSIAPVDLAQAAIGPGISVFSRYSRVREADGSDMSVRDALLLINSTLDEVIGEQESDFDPDTRFAVKWYRQYGWIQENSGIADQLARSSDTSIGALERGGIFEAKGGRARLLSPTQLENEWDIGADEHVSVWEATVRLAAVMAKHGADEVAGLLPLVQTRVSLDAVKELGFLLFHEAEKKRDTKDALLFNGLVSAWGDVNEQAQKHAGSLRSVQQAFDFDEEEG
ncbi:DUF1156 domain-containing protein [Microbacterium sp.]|uniref:DUF1156 domain-containing protein n=1 Tax=Microbacterium sp. TaxID=51671 RepID=UPI003F712B87